MSDFRPLNTILAAQVVLSPASVAAATTVEQTFTVTGCPSSAIAVFARLDTQPAGIAIVGARAVSDDTIGIEFANDTAGALVPTSGVYTILLYR